MALNSARRAVFDTNELLENILSYLPSPELFVLSRVSKQWSGVIASSPGLQETMFLRPKSATPRETWILDGYSNPGSVSTISAYQMYTERAGVPKFRRVYDDKTRNDSFLSPLTLNPILRLADFILKPDIGTVIQGISSCTLRPLLRSLADLAAVERVCCVWADAVSICVRPAALRRNCSLWKAHLSDPPCRVAQVKVVVKYQGPQPYRSPAPEPWEGCHVESDARLTLGDILLAASKSGKLDCCKFDDGHLWKDLGSELKEMIDDAAEPSGWMGIEEVEDVTLYIQLMRDGNDRPLVVTEKDRAAVAFEEDRAAAIEELRADVVTD